LVGALNSELIEEIISLTELLRLPFFPIQSRNKFLIVLPIIMKLSLSFFENSVFFAIFNNTRSRSVILKDKQPSFKTASLVLNSHRRLVSNVV